VGLDLVRWLEQHAVGDAGERDGRGVVGLAPEKRANPVLSTEEAIVPAPDGVADEIVRDVREVLGRVVFLEALDEWLDNLR
jgi:hypothetical protein